MHKEVAEELMGRFKLVVIEYAKHFGATEACSEFNVPRSTCFFTSVRLKPGSENGMFPFAIPQSYGDPLMFEL